MVRIRTAVAGIDQEPLTDWLWLFSFLVLPFASYLSLGVLSLLLLVALYQRSDEIFTVLWQRGFVLLTGGLMLSAAFALEPSNAFLQIANFVPYFLLFAVLVTNNGLRYRAVVKLDGLAKALLLASIPISLIALFEYVIQFEAIAVHLRPLDGFAWVFDNPFGHRAHAILSHPNILSAYLVMMLGLGLGLTLQQLARVRTAPLRLPSAWIYTATVLSLVGIFCTGSRNGLMVAIAQLLVAGCFLRRSRWVGLIGLGFAIALITGTVLLGAGGRELSLSAFTQDPRVSVWQIAGSLIWQRPWLGWGLGSFGMLYVPFSAPGYEQIHHAHNLWLYLASEVGLPLMVAFSWVIGRLYGSGVRTLITKKLSQWHRSLLLSYLFAFGGCVGFGLFDVTLFDARLNVLGWLMLAAIGLLSRR
ncbi:MAG: hypothetical protein F6J97_06890 [Leptolyngbya sp. SIO4C1]|nr:hypothetical protein [Leptolyngbya sp. SIO4C1]